MVNEKKDFVLPEELIGRFAVVKLWPEIKTAEDECIARIKRSAEYLNIICNEVYADGSFLDGPDGKVSSENVDFVLHLHFDTPKNYDAFSFAALWNPIDFYHEWGYHRTSRNLLSHDDFISCNSDAADDHLRRLIRNGDAHLPPYFHLHHSLPDIVYPPSIGDGKLFYVGINWEAINGGVSRHQEVLKQLDKTGELRIYGPKLFQGFNVWKGYDSYVKEIPFDGISMIDEIAKAGIALVLSSKAHKNSEMMSSRLFEGIAAGALVICDENPFAKKFFGDCLLYIDTRASPESISDAILSHLDWAHKNHNEALGKIRKAQEIFRQKFTMIGSIKEIYLGLTERKNRLSELCNPQQEGGELTVGAYFLMPDYSEKVLIEHIYSILCQSYSSFSPTIVVDTVDARMHKDRIKKLLKNLPIKIELMAVNFYASTTDKVARYKSPLGSVVLKLLKSIQRVDAFLVVKDNESLISNHISVLAGALKRSPDTDCAATAAILRDGDSPVHSVHETLDFGWNNPMGPTGAARFIFRSSSIPDDVSVALPYLNERALAALIGNKKIDQQMPSTVFIHLVKQDETDYLAEIKESEVIRGYAPESMRVRAGFCVPPISKSQVISSVSAQPMNLLRLLILCTNVSWLKKQVKAIRDQGIKKRLTVLRSRIIA